MNKLSKIGKKVKCDLSGIFYKDLEKQHRITMDKFLKLGKNRLNSNFDFFAKI